MRPMYVRDRRIACRQLKSGGRRDGKNLGGIHRGVHHSVPDFNGPTVRAVRGYDELNMDPSANEAEE